MASFDFDLEQQYNSDNLIWVSSTRGGLQEPPALDFTQDRNGKIRVQQVLSKFQQSSGIIQVGFQLLQIQGQEVADYEGGVDEIQKVIQESLSLEMVLLRSTTDIGSKLKASETCNKDNRISVSNDNRTSDKKIQNRPKRRGTIHTPGEGWVKIVPKPMEDPFASLGQRYKYNNIAWACNTRHSLRQPVPLQLIQDDEDCSTIRIHQIDPNFQEATGLQVGQQVVQLQEKDVDSYEDFQEIKDIVRESLKLQLIVLRSTAVKATEKGNSSTTDNTEIITTKEEEESIYTATSSTEFTVDESAAEEESPHQEEPQPASDQLLVVVENPSVAVEDPSLVVKEPVSMPIFDDPSAI
ncbi:unnamed protein product [Cylindrotheca closterium]|uniref:PDZ domain-containing protein n=1 Tax=Cylindrotheca closterium TaxID=2856 RepID=A0AAD2CFF9_9STRA|nr:unnamed protein product [Cylindrotheca closterium]